MINVKFQGKRLDNSGWVHGDLIASSGRAWIRDKSDKYTNPRLIGDGVADFRCVEVNPATIGQYINLKDERGRGKEIFKGDIVRVTQACGEEYIGEVVWDEDRHAWAVDSNDQEELVEFASIVHCEHWVEVIGNATDNPELLK